MGLVLAWWSSPPCPTTGSPSGVGNIEDGGVSSSGDVGAVKIGWLCTKSITTHIPFSYIRVLKTSAAGTYIFVKSEGLTLVRKTF